MLRKVFLVFTRLIAIALAVLGLWTGFVMTWLALVSLLEGDWGASIGLAVGVLILQYGLRLSAFAVLGRDAIWDACCRSQRAREVAA